jgi:PAS domain S-box-containing protein
MKLLLDALELITAPPGTLIYHIVTLFAIQLILGIAFGHWNRHRRDSAARRLLWLAVGLLLSRASLMLLAVLDRAGLVDPWLILPPLERFLEFTTLTLSAWALLPILRQKPQLSTTFLVVILLLAGGLYAASATRWPQAEAVDLAYNGYWQAQVWEYATITLIALALIASLAWRGNDWGLLTCLLGLWLTGHILQVALPMHDSHTAGWVRLSNLTALPLLTGLVYRRALLAPATFSESEATTLGTLGILKAVRHIEAGRDIDAALGLAASSLARALDADMVAIGRPADGPAKGMRIASLHPTASMMLTQQEPTLLISRHPLLATALQSSHMEQAISPRKVATTTKLYHRLGFERPGPLLIHPLIDGKTPLGVIIVGNPISQRPPSERDEQVTRAIGSALTAALATASRREEQILEKKLAQAREEATRMTERVEALEADLKQQQERAEELTTKLRLREQEAEQQDESTELWQGKLDELTETRAALEAELTNWKRRAEEAIELQDELEQKLKATQAQIQKTDQVTKQPIECTLGGLLVGDNNGRISLVSQGVYQMLGLRSSEMEDKHLQDLFHAPAWKEAVEQISRQEMETGEAIKVNLKHDGHVVQAELTRLPDNALACLLYAEKAAPSQSEELSTLIDNIRTPLTSIAGYTDLLLNESMGILGESQRRFLLRIEANVERLKRLLNDLIKVTDMDTGQVTLAPETVEVVSVIEYAISSLSARFNERDLKIEINMPPELPPVYADRDSLHQIMLNLLSNAAQCSEPGSKIVVQAQMEGQDERFGGLPAYVLVSVTDTGGGIAAEDLPRVFRRFYRADNPLIEGLGETGVGLSIAKALVEANGGRIWVESEQGAGTTFSFIMPIASEED